MQRNVLIAHSDPANQREIADWYSREGFSPIVADDAAACLAVLKRCTPTLIVLDQNLLGGVDGVVDCMRKDRRLRGLPILMANIRHRQQRRRNSSPPRFVTASLTDVSLPSSESY